MIAACDIARKVLRRETGMHVKATFHAVASMVLCVRPPYLSETVAESSVFRVAVVIALSSLSSPVCYVAL